MAAQACFSARFSGLRRSPAAWRPTAMAPEDTRITSFPIFFRSHSSRTRISSFVRLMAPVSGWVMEELPILTTILFLFFNSSLVFIFTLLGSRVYLISPNFRANLIMRWPFGISASSSMVIPRNVIMPTQYTTTPTRMAITVPAVLPAILLTPA